MSQAAKIANEKFHCGKVADGAGMADMAVPLVVNSEVSKGFFFEKKKQKTFSTFGRGTFQCPV
jgi:hypothetical protein